jgi:hypothetical protein
MTLINRGRRQWTADDIRHRERHRQVRAGIRQTHGIIGWACPACGTHQTTEYHLDTWAPLGWVGVACQSGDHARDLIRCGLKSRVELDPARNDTAAAWVAWTQARYTYEHTVEGYQRRLDGYYGPLSGLERPMAPPPRWTHPTPPYATTDPLAGRYPVRLLEASTMSHPLYCVLHLPSGHVHAVLKTDYTSDDDGLRYGELIISPPERDDLRAEVALLLPEDERESFEAERWSFDARRPYGLEAWCWVPRGHTKAKHADTDADTDTDADAELAEWIDGEELLTVTAEVIEVIDTEDV